MRLNNAVHHRQAQTGTLTCRLGSKEWFENFLQRRCVHALTAIADGKPHHSAGVPVAQRVQRGMCIDPCRIGDHGVQPDTNASGALRHRLHRVGGQVDQDLLDMGGIRKYRGNVGITLNVEGQARGQGRAQQSHHLCDHRSEHGGLARSRLPPAEAQNLAHQSLRARGGLANFLQTLQSQRIGARILTRQFGVAQDAGNNVVEVVRNAAGERADDPHLLRFAQLRFERRAGSLCLLALGAVALGKFRRRILARNQRHISRRVARARRMKHISFVPDCRRRGIVVREVAQSSEHVPIQVRAHQIVDRSARRIAQGPGAKNVAANDVESGRFRAPIRYARGR